MRDLPGDRCGCQASPRGRRLIEWTRWEGRLWSPPCGQPPCTPDTDGQEGGRGDFKSRAVTQKIIIIIIINSADETSGRLRTSGRGSRRPGRCPQLPGSASSASGRAGPQTERCRPRSHIPRLHTPFQTGRISFLQNYPCLIHRDGKWISGCQGLRGRGRGRAWVSFGVRRPCWRQWGAGAAAQLCELTRKH